MSSVSGVSSGSSAYEFLKTFGAGTTTGAFSSDLSSAAETDETSIKTDASKMVTALDSDSDSKLSKTEFTSSGLSSDAFDSIDKNGDSSVTADELTNAYYTQRLDQTSKSMITQFDTDGDGALSSTEASTAGISSDLFNTLDADGDSKLSAKELNESNPQQTMLHKYKALIEGISGTSSTTGSTSTTA